MTNLKTNDIMGENLKEYQHPQWGTILGYATEIHLAVLKDEIKELQNRLDPNETGYLLPTISTLQQRVREMEKNGSREG